MLSASAWSIPRKLSSWNTQHWRNEPLLGGTSLAKTLILSTQILAWIHIWEWCVSKGTHSSIWLSRTWVFLPWGNLLAFQDLSTEALHRIKRNSHSWLYLRPGAAYGHHSLYPSITHILLEIMSQNLRQVSLKYKSSSTGFGETAQDLNYGCV